MTDEKIARINFLSKKSRTADGLTQKEKAEQAQLRSEYVAAMRQSLGSQLENVRIINEKGKIVPLPKKNNVQ